MAKKYYLLDLSHDKRNIRRMNLCHVAAYASLYYGYWYNERNIKEFWKFDDFHPSRTIIDENISSSNIKWYLHNKVQINNRVWNPDYINGLSQYGKVIFWNYSFPTFRWHYNNNIIEILKESPFYGRLCKNCKSIAINNNCYQWGQAAILCLKYNEKSISYMAGVLSSAKKKIINGQTYAAYNLRIGKILKKWNIPIEKEKNRAVYISPFWVALFVPWMPNCCQHWAKERNAYRVEEYSLITWRVYSGLDIKTNAIPYLISRRWFFIKYKTIKDLERRWVENNLVGLDLRIKDVIQKYSSNEVEIRYNNINENNKNDKRV